MMSRIDSVKNGFPLVFHAHHFSSLILFPLISRGIGYAHKKRVTVCFSNYTSSYKGTERLLRWYRAVSGAAWCGVMVWCVFVLRL